MSKTPKEKKAAKAPVLKDGRAILGENVRVARARMHLNIVELAKLSGVSRKQISKIEKGGVNATIQTVEILARALGTTAVALLTKSPPTLF